MPQPTDVQQSNSNQFQNQRPAGTEPRKSEAVTALTDGLSAGAHEISKEIQHVAGDVAGEAKKAAETKLDAGRDFAAEQLGSVADALRHTTEHLRSQDSGLSDYVARAASSVESVSRYMQTRTVSQLIGDVEGFARREPALFLGGAFVLGLVGGRFLKSATPRPTRSAATPGSAAGARYETRLGGWPQLNPSTNPPASNQPNNGTGAVG